ncbi:hypothetical protein MKJ04_01080 [Pontibacter sp. E15-1]|uniref:adenylate/guanylate cyclase domain-containing protein n=1 Tax=Pontibacter sp. E15-1 TaxID=2919918 RepID=UPI001F502053|nr:adenylate/guanylate cyclase domain-containing protein [Pontibacter sp. E15-1]MCJ8163414.1 hypothetical protein [Pontibacter sp. E15-1]
MLKHIVATLLFVLVSTYVLAQLGNPFVQSFPPTAYQSYAYISSPQNWGIVQDNRGIIYVSNTSGVLEYDGLNWRMVAGTAGLGRTQLARNSEGKIFACSSTDMGFLSPDSAGKMQFVSLLPRLRGDQANLDFKKAAAVSRDVYFLTENKLFRWTGTHFRIWRSEAGYSRIFSIHNRLYVVEKEKGILLLEHDRFLTLPGSEGIKGLMVSALLPLPATKASTLNFLIATYESGLYRYRDHTLEKLSPTSIMSEISFLHGISLSDGTFALATQGAGILILDQEGRVKKVIDQETGLNDNTAMALCIDQEGGLWAALNKGISRIDYPSPISYLNKSTGLDGIVLDILKKGPLLYVGTSSGVHIASELDPTPTFRKLPLLQKEVWKIVDAGDTLLLANSKGIYTLADSSLHRVSPVGGNITYKTIHRSTVYPARFYIGTSGGLALLTHRSGEWKWEGNIKAVKHPVTSLVQDRAGKIWASSDTSISIIADAKEYGLKPPVLNLKLSERILNDFDQLPLYAVKGKIYLGTSKGLYSFKKDGQKYRLLPDATFGKRFAGGTKEAINLTEDRNGNVWLTSEFRTGMLRKTAQNSYTWDTIPLSRVPRVDVWTIYPDAAGVVWLATTEGIFSYNPFVPKNYRTQQKTLLRKVNLLGDSTVFYGAFANKGTATVAQTPQFEFVLPHAVKSISFEYTATSYDAPGQLLYSYMLEGEDEKWSLWTTETKREFTGLDEGTYVFKVRSKNIYGTVNQPTTFAFTSLPPFYRTWWAYTLYVVLYGLVIWGFVKIKHRHLIATQKSLEKVVHERTAQLEEEKKKSDDLLLNILPSETAEELKAKGRALARSYKAATVLFTDFKDFTKISEHLTPEELVAVIDFYFCAFDRIITKYNIEKIKTIGDAYMCAGGIPNPGANTPTDVVKAGLEILDFVQNLNPDNKRLKHHKFEIRIGIHTGPVVAGIVGTTKFAYDIWGDTVNTAARMESCGEVGKVNISGATYTLIKDDFRCSYRGKVEAKNKGDIDMYFVEAIVPHPVLL